MGTAPIPRHAVKWSLPEATSIFRLKYGDPNALGEMQENKGYELCVEMRSNCGDAAASRSKLQIQLR